MPIESVPVYAIIPARGGSKGLKNKNLRRIGFESLVERAIRTAFEVDQIDRCVVTSDSAEILNQAKIAGAEVHERSLQASSDEASSSDVLVDLMKSGIFDLHDSNPFFVYLQPTSPMRTSRHIREALSQVANANSTMCVSLSRRSLLMEKLVHVDSLSGTVRTVGSPNAATGNRQAMGRQMYLPNGAIYIFRYSDFVANEAFPIVGGIPYWMDEISSIDIDSEYDLALVNDLERK